MINYYKILMCLFILLLSNISINAQEIKAPEGFSPQIGAMVSMLEDLKERVTQSVSKFTIEETDFLLDEKANRIGALIYHLAATEKFYQIYTFEERGANSAEKEEWSLAQSLGEKARDELVGKPIQYYLDIWDEVREETLRILKTKDDKWFESKLKESRNMNNHWAWYHVMEHQANHMGQIRLISKRMK